MALPKNSKHYYSFVDINGAVESLINRMREEGWAPDLIVGITRGGLVPAVMLSHKLGCNMMALNWSSTNDDLRVSDCAMAEDAVHGKRILLVDNICYSGETLRGIQKDWNSSVRDDIGWNITTRFAVIDYNEASGFPVDYYSNKVQDKGRIGYPWEDK